MTAARCGGRWCTTSCRRRRWRGAGQEPARALRCAHAAPAARARTLRTTRASPTPARAYRSLAGPLATLMPRRLRAPGLKARRSRRRGARAPVSCRECVRVATSYVMLVVVRRVLSASKDQRQRRKGWPCAPLGPPEAKLRAEGVHQNREFAGRTAPKKRNRLLLLHQNREFALRVSFSSRSKSNLQVIVKRT